MTERAAIQLRRVAMACLVAIVLMVAADLAPASGAVVPVCDSEFLTLSHPVCAQRVVDGLGEIVDLTVTDSGDIHVLGADGTIAAVRPGAEVETAHFQLPGALLLEAGYRSLLVGTHDGVSRHRFARGELVPEVEGEQVVADRPSSLALARLGRLFVATSAADCDGSCDEVRVFDALDASPAAGRQILPTDGRVLALDAMAGRDLVLGLVASEGRTVLTSIGDHHGGCVTEECVSATVPIAGDHSSMVIVPGDELGFDEQIALVASGHEVWSVFFEGGGAVSVELLVASPGAAFQVASSPEGETYVADASGGIVWRLWAER
ncbi:MAG: hypothetical protein ACFCVC_09750 [Acidimicrobiia bacterium]